MEEYYDQTELNRKLPADVKEKWLTALRSGDYKQVKAALRKMRSDKKIGYCCLGVLSDIFIADKLALDPQCEVGWQKDSGFVRNKKFTLVTSYTESRMGMPTHSVNSWANRGYDGWLVYVDEADAKKFNKDTMLNNVTLYDLNDRGVSFKTIADVIEKYL